MFLIFRLVLVFFFISLDVLAIGVSPTLLTISPKEPIANLTVSNEGDLPVTMQLELVKWTQYKEKEVYEVTEDLIATPQIFTISPQSSQLIRVGLERAIYSNKEKAYRLFVQEVIPRKILKKRNELKMALRLSLPVIIQSLSPVQQNLVWHVKPSPGAYHIVAENKGNNVVFINLLEGFSDNKQSVMQPLTTFAYLLPGSKRHWVIKRTSKHNMAWLKASVNSQTVSVNVV